MYMLPKYILWSRGGGERGILAGNVSGLFLSYNDVQASSLFSTIRLKTEEGHCCWTTFSSTNSFVRLLE